MTYLDKRAIIVNCIIIAYYAFFAPLSKKRTSEARVFFDIIFIRVRVRQKRGKVSNASVFRNGTVADNTLNGVVELMVNVKEQKLGQNTRMSFSKSSFPCELPNLVEVQTKSFKWFLEEGLMEVLRDISPITDHSDNLVIEFVSYSIDQKPKYTVEECKERDANYAAPLKDLLDINTPK